MLGLPHDSGVTIRQDKSKQIIYVVVQLIMTWEIGLDDDDQKEKKRKKIGWKTKVTGRINQDRGIKEMGR